MKKITINEIINDIKTEYEEQKNTIEYLKEQEEYKHYIQYHEKVAVSCEQIIEWLEKLKVLETEDSNMYNLGTEKMCKIMREVSNLPKDILKNIFGEESIEKILFVYNANEIIEITEKHFNRTI